MKTTAYIVFSIVVALIGMTVIGAACILAVWVWIKAAQ